MIIPPAVFDAVAMNFILRSVNKLRTLTSQVRQVSQQCFGSLQSTFYKQQMRFCIVVLLMKIRLQRTFLGKIVCYCAQLANGYQEERSMQEKTSIILNAKASSLINLWITHSLYSSCYRKIHLRIGGTPPIKVSSSKNIWTALIYQ